MKGMLIVHAPLGVGKVVLVPLGNNTMYKMIQKRIVNAENIICDK